jgi:hypothetical protein
MRMSNCIIPTDIAGSVSCLSANMCLSCIRFKVYAPGTDVHRSGGWSGHVCVDGRALCVASAIVFCVVKLYSVLVWL